MSQSCRHVGIEFDRPQIDVQIKAVSQPSPQHPRFSAVRQAHCGQSRRSLENGIGLSALGSGQLRQAEQAFDLSLQSRPGAEHAMLMAAHLATLGHYDEALRFSDIALRQYDSDSGELWSAERVRREDILSFQQQVRSDRDSVSGGDRR